MSFQLCLFDLDNTLLHTEDLVDFRGFQFVGVQPPEYVIALKARAAAKSGREIYSLDFLNGLRIRFPLLKFGVFTRSPSTYAQTLLTHYYPGFNWNTVIAFEQVAHTKPNPEGIFRAMQSLGISDASKVVLVGDEKVDVVCAYRAGVWSVVDTSSWPRPNVTDNYWARERVPDAIIDRTAQLIEFLQDPYNWLPILEKYQAKGTQNSDEWIYVDVINHFDKSGDNTGYVPISVLGRRFNDTAELGRRQWHAISREIEAHKDALVFPIHWVAAARTFICMCAQRHRNQKFTVTVIPAKMGRTPRLENFLNQIKQSDIYEPIIPGIKIDFVPGILSYTDGVRSQHMDTANPADRFVNVRDHLTVSTTHKIDGAYVVFDDVVTTGATLFYAERYLKKRGAAAVYPVSLTKAISAQ